jgi:peptidoglycan/LPS O-acetylase OafA/YrhL
MSIGAWIEKAVRPTLLVVTGAYAAIVYVNHQFPATRGEMSDTRDGVGLLWFALLALSGYFDWKRRRTSPPVETSPVQSGVYVVVATGLAATVALAAGFHTAGDLVPAAIALLCTVVAAVLVGRFASKHAGEIGEARFASPMNPAEDVASPHRSG